MAFPDPSLAGNFAPVSDELTVTGLPVVGALPPELDGQYLRLGPNPVRRSAEPAARRGTDAMVHAVELRGGHALVYRNRWILTPHTAGVLGLGPAVDEIDGCERLVRVGRRVLAFGRSGAAYEVGIDLSTWRTPGLQVIRSDRCLADRRPSHAWHRLQVGATGRVVRTLVPGRTLALERRDGTTGRLTVDVVDPTPQGWLVSGAPREGDVVRHAYTTAFDGGRPFADSVVHRHDLVRGGRTSFDFGPGRHPGELTFVPDGRGTGDGGWLLVFVHDDRRGADDLVVLHAGHPDEGPVATVALPRRVPYGWHALWRPR